MPVSVAEANNVVAQFKADFRAFTVFDTADPRELTSAAKSMHKRALMHKTVNVNWRHGFEQTGWAAHEDTTSMAKERSHTMVSSEVSELLVNFSKTVVRCVGARKLVSQKLAWVFAWREKCSTRPSSTML